MTLLCLHFLFLQVRTLAKIKAGMRFMRNAILWQITALVLDFATVGQLSVIIFYRICEDSSGYNQHQQNETAKPTQIVGELQV